MSHLKTTLFDAQSGTGAVIVLSGGSGIGKTRVTEVIELEASDASFIRAWGYCREHGDTPSLGPIVALLRDVSERVAPALAADARYQALVPELAVLLPELAISSAPSAAEPEKAASAIEPPSKHRVFDAVVRALTLASEHRPLLLVIDDLHRADEATLELLQHLLPVVSRTRILLLATARNVNEAACAPALSRVLGHRNVAVLGVLRGELVVFLRRVGIAAVGHVGAQFRRTRARPATLRSSDRRQRKRRFEGSGRRCAAGARSLQPLAGKRLRSVDVERCQVDRVDIAAQDR